MRALSANAGRPARFRRPPRHRSLRGRLDPVNTGSGISRAGALTTELGPWVTSEVPVTIGAAGAEAGSVVLGWTGRKPAGPVPACEPA